jgi:hypothetical protein
MVSGPSRARLPALLLVVVGLGTALYAGVHAHDHYDPYRTEHTYSVSEFDEQRHGQYVFRYASLSNESKAVTQSALNASRGNVTVSGDRENPTEEFYLGSGPYYILDDGEYYCLEFRQSWSGSVRTQSGNLSTIADQQCLDDPREDPSGFYPNESALSSDAKDVIASAIEAPDNEISRYGSTPPEFEDGADAPSFGWGEYVVHYDGTYYRLSVDRQPWTGLIFYLFAILGTIGISIAAIGAACDRLRWVNTPTALLSGIAIVGGSLWLPTVGLLPEEFFAENIGSVFLSSIVVPFVIWVFLTWYR